MIISRAERLRGYSEYAFYEAVKEYNDSVLSLGEDDKAIKIREAKALRKNFIENLKKRNVQGKQMNIDFFNFNGLRDSLNETLRERFETDSDVVDIKSAYNDYKQMTGFQNGRNDIPNGFIYPLTPYDDRFENFEKVFDNGSNLGGINGNRSISDVINLNDRGDNKFYSNISLNYENDRNKKPFFSLNERGNFVGLNDLSGMAKFKSYFDRDEYYSLLNWVNNPNDFRASSEDIKKRMENTDKAVNVLQTLVDEGYSYNIQKDLNPGQIKCNIDNTSISVRLTETLDNSAYIGKIYDNGAEVRITSTYRGKGNKPLSYTPNSEDINNMIKFAMGENVQKSDYKDPVGSVGIYKRAVRGKPVAHNKVYAGNKKLVYVYGDALDPYGRKDARFNNKLNIDFSGANRTFGGLSIRDSESAENYLKDNINLARSNFIEELEIDRLIEESSEFLNDEEHDYRLSKDETIATIQQNYIDLLTDKSDNLLRVGEDLERYNELYDMANNPNVSSADKAVYLNEMNNMIYPLENDSETIIRKHAKDSADYRVGNFEKTFNDKRYNILGISRYQGKAESVESVKNNLIKATHVLNIPIDDLIADDDYANVLKNQAIRFDEDSAKSMKDLDSPFMQSMYNTVKTSLEGNGYSFNEDDIKIDDNGVVKYEVSCASGEKYKGSNNFKNSVGYVGQIFEPDELGVVYTKFAGDNNYAFVPGYEATVIANKDGENKSMEERTKLRGYRQAMVSSIKYRIRQDALEFASSGSGEFGSCYSLNNTYSHLYDTRHNYDFIKEFEEQGMSRENIEALIKTEGSRVRYQSRFRDNSTIYAKHSYDLDYYDKLNDLAYTPFNLTNNRDISILSEESDGYFDPIMTTATSTNQGSLRYMVEGCKVDDDGFLIKSDDENDRNILMKQDFMKYVGYNPFDRQNMTVSNILQASSISEPSNTALMNFGGWNQDDGIVISKDYAKKTRMRGADGNLRDLMVGDKLSDLHGNKGVVSLIVDKDMSLEEAKEKNLVNEVSWFKQNPDCEVVMAPFSAPSRFNGGSGREMMSREVSDIKDKDGNVIKGGMGQIRFIVTDKAADIKTHVYDDEELMAGNGRKASSQMAWVYQSKDAKGILKECYGDNLKSISDLREYLTVAGFDITETGKFTKGLRQNEKEEREVFKLPDEIEKTKTGKASVRGIKRNFLESISKNGGIMEIPFKLDMPSGVKTALLNKEKDGFCDMSEESLNKLNIDIKNGKYVKGEGYKRSEIGYGLPVLSTYLRSSVDLTGDERSYHDYTASYASIYENAINFKNAVQRYEAGDLDRKSCLLEMKNFKSKAQKQYNELCSKIEQREFEGKHNTFREGIMSKKMPDSATAIWSEDPRNKLEEVSVSKSIANKIHINDGDYIMIGRDPMLRDGACRYMKAKIDENLIGIAVNPCMSKSMDGDFDGDTIAVINFHSKDAKKDGMDKFSMKANLLDYGSVLEDGDYPLSFHDSLDIKVACHYDDDLNKRLDVLKKKINKDERNFREGKLTDSEIDKLRENNLEGLNDFYKDSYDKGFGKAYIQYDNIKDHLKSIHEACVETGAKGNDSKIQNYAKFFGCEIDFDDKGGLDYDSIKLSDKSLVPRKDQMQTMTATAVKSFATGLGGTVSQRAVAAGRDNVIKDMLEITYPVTQSILQSKHNAQEAEHKYNMLLGPVKDLWNGYKMEQNADLSWSAKLNDKGQKIQAKKDEWVKSFEDMYTSSTEDGGLNVSINLKYVKNVADFLSDKKGIMRSVESKNFRSSLDIMAYGLYGEDKKSGFSYLSDLCDENRSLFETKTDKDFAPVIVRRSIEAEENKDFDNIRDDYLIKDDMKDNRKEKQIRGDRVKTNIIRHYNHLMEDDGEKVEEGGYSY